jgi:hypothetical protein
MMVSITRIVIFLYCFCFCWVVQAEDSVNDMVITMRDSGYTLGDKIQMVATFTLPAQQTIAEESLPLVGRVSPWLDIQALAIKQNKQRVQLKLTWQIFATVEIAQPLKTPELILKTAGKEPQTIIIPAQSFYYSPVLPMPPLKDINRRANLVPPSVDTAKPFYYFSACCGLFLFCGLLWLWLTDSLPWIPFQPKPMTKLVRQLKSQSTGLTRSQLREIHAALNQCAGVSLYPDNLSQLFHRAPYFANEEASVTQFFNQSWSQFYADKPSAQPTIDLKATQQWVQRVAIAERLFGRRVSAQKSRYAT